MKITDYKTIKNECKNIRMALTNFFLGINNFVEGFEQEMIEDYGIAYDMIDKNFWAVKGVEAILNDDEKQSSMGKRKFYSLSRIKANYHKNLFQEFKSLLLKECQEKNVDFKKVWSWLGFEKQDSFWKFVYKKSYKLNTKDVFGDDVSLEISRNPKTLESLISDFEKTLLPDRINFLEREITDLTKIQNYYVL